MEYKRKHPHPGWPGKPQPSGIGIVPRWFTIIALTLGLLAVAPSQTVAPAFAVDTPAARSHTIDYIVVSKTASTDFLSDTDIQLRTNKVSDWWKQASHGVVAAISKGSVIRVPNFTGDFCGLLAGSDFIRNTLPWSPEVYIANNNGRHLVVVGEDTEWRCPYAGLTLAGGDNLSASGIALLDAESFYPNEDENLMEDASVLAHELGHGFGLGHAGAGSSGCSPRYWDGPYYYYDGTTVAADGCAFNDYGDRPNLMSDARNLNKMRLNGVQKFELGLIKPGTGMLDVNAETQERLIEINDGYTAGFDLLQSVRLTTDDPDGPGPCTAPVYQIDYDSNMGGVQILRVPTRTDCGTRYMAQRKMTVALRSGDLRTYFVAGESRLTQTGKVQIRVVKVDTDKKTATIGIRRTDVPGFAALHLNSIGFDANNQLVMAEVGDQERVTVTTTGQPWTASSDQPWASVTPSGTNGGDVVVSVTPNPTDVWRTAVVTVRAGTGETRFTVAQWPGPRQDDCGNWSPFTCIWSDIASPIRGTIETAGDVDGFRFTPPVTGTWSFTIIGSGTGGLPDPAGSLTWGDGPMSQDSSSTGNQQYQVTAQMTAYQSYHVKVSGNNGSTGTYTVSAVGPQPQISLSNNTWSASGNGDGINITVWSNTTWKMGELPDWLHTSFPYGPSGVKPTLWADPNTSGQARTWNVTFTAGGQTATVAVSQPAGGIPPGDCGSTAGTACTWSDLLTSLRGGIDYFGDRDWFKMTPDVSGFWSFVSSGVGSGLIYAADGATPVSWDQVGFRGGFGAGAILTAGQTYYLEIVDSGNYREGYTLTAIKPAEATISVSPSTWTAPSAGGTLVVQVTTTGYWQLNLPDWITASRTFGNGSAQVTLNASGNYTGASRNGSAEFTIPGKQATVTVTQAAWVRTDYVTPLSLHASSRGGYFRMNVVSDSSWRVLVLMPAPVNWVRFSQTSGMGNTAVTVRVAPNERPQGRYVYVAFVVGSQVSLVRIQQSP